MIWNSYVIKLYFKNYAEKRICDSLKSKGEAQKDIYVPVDTYDQSSTCNSPQVKYTCK